MEARRCVGAGVEATTRDGDGEGDDDDALGVQTMPQNGGQRCKGNEAQA